MSRSIGDDWKDAVPVFIPVKSLASLWPDPVLCTSAYESRLVLLIGPAFLYQP